MKAIGKGEAFMRTWVGLALLMAASAGAAQDSSNFFYAPVPRWQAEPDMEEVCAAARRECPQLAGLPEIVTTIAYDELYDANGRLSGLRLVRGTGCAPLDENFLLGQRRFHDDFHREGQSDLDGIRVEAQPGVDVTRIRLVKSSESQYSTGCSG
jgi:hypothetical protein